MSSSQSVKRVSPAGGNLFQNIKAMSTAAEASGIRLIRLSIGQPAGPAPEPARSASAIAVVSENETMHEYQDNGSPGCPDFAKKFALAHLSVDFPADSESIDYLPIPGIKPILWMIPLACGSHERGKDFLVAVTTKPGYPTPRDQCAYLQAPFQEIVLNPDNRFLFDPAVLEGVDLVMMNYPHNPSGQVAHSRWLHDLCFYCEQQGIRIFNDAAYSMLAGCSCEHMPLAEIAPEYPKLSWAEAFSVSKLGNMTGWRIGAMVGSKDFINDIRQIKGNCDSGFAAPLACGALMLVTGYRDEINKYRDMYESRLRHLCSALTGAGMKMATRPKAGFFSLWVLPKTAFGIEITSAEHFNKLMIEKTGIVGVHFEPSYIRYSVAQLDVTNPDILEEITRGFVRADIGY